MAMYAKYRSLGNQEGSKSTKSAVLTIKNEEHKKLIIANNNIVCVDIHATWCQPCKDISGKYDEYSMAYPNCVFVKEDIEQNITPGIKGVPTFMFYKNGQLVSSIVGADIKKVEETVNDLSR
jgi:thioredoxin 1